MKEKALGKLIEITLISLFLYLLLFVFPNMDTFNINSFLNWDALKNFGN
ncbi:hypothetical protein [Virgibacillus oceani]|uniref:Uncharacterized protein n=1 Tax=Virgibacillus oceani TaxID=1479511 RepID=A0A917H167_9BACI|nr:hypothetical protein [Virgibacillus oceani]GGG64663.1 hypothetical protein GCM10011398_05340 [Virgibacillus oceani]